MERVPMLRQLISQLEEVLELYGFPPPSSSQTRGPPRSASRWCVFDIETGFLESTCNDLRPMITAGNSYSMKTVEYGGSPAKKAREVCTIISRSSSDIMDEDIWKELPEDLLEAVIARLPVEAFFRFRVVCHKWNILLSSPSFFQQSDQKRRSEPWFLVTTIAYGKMGSIYNPVSQRWYHPLPPLLLPTDKRLMPVASAGGLICFFDFKKTFYVCNPLTQSWKELPAPSIRMASRLSIGMTLNSECYKILCIGYGGEYGIYDSMKNAWSFPGNMFSAVVAPYARSARSPAICINRTLYFLCHAPDGLLSFDMETGIWKQFFVPAPQHLTNKMLAECSGRIMLVGLLKKNAATCICIWELQKMTLLWKEVDRMPNVWSLEFYGKQVKMTCLGNKGSIMLSLRSWHTNWLITYDASSREWAKVPRPTLSWKQFICGTAFQPCLAALP